MKSNIVLLKLLLNDFQNIEVHLPIRVELQETISQLREEQKKLQKVNARNKNWKERFSKLREMASDTYRLLGQLEINSDTYLLLESQLKEFRKIDLRRSVTHNKDIIRDISFNS